MSDLTSRQVDAITHAHIDMVAGDEIFNGDSPIDESHWCELSVAFHNTRRELEEAFPWLLNNHTSDVKKESK